MNNSSQIPNDLIAKIKFLPDIFFLLKEDGTILDYLLNNENIKIFNDLDKGNNLFDKKCQSIKKLFQETIVRAKKEQKAQSLETTIECKDHKQPFLFRINYLKKDMIVVFGLQLQSLQALKSIKTEKEKEEVFFNTLFENNEDAIFLMTDKQFIECNKKTLKIFGCKKKEDIIGHHPAEFSPEKQPGGISSKKLSQEKINAAFAGKPQIFEWIHAKKNKSEFYAQVSLNLIEYQNEKMLLAIIRDISAIKNHEKKLSEQYQEVQTQNEEIQSQNEEYASLMQQLRSNQTELKQALQLLMVSEQKFRALAETSPAAFLIIQENKFVYMNDAGYQMLGIDSPEELEKLFFWDIVYEEDRAMVKERGIQRQKGAKLIPHYDFRIINKKLGPIWINFSATNYPFEGKPALIGMAINIHEKKLLADKIATNAENLAVTLHSIGDAVIVTDNKGKITNMNPVAEKLCGRRLKTAKGKPLSEVFQIINAQTGGKVNNPVREVLKGEKIVGLANHTVLISRNRNRYHIEDSAAPIFKGDELIGVVLVFRDITEKYTREQELKKNAILFRTIFDQNAMGTIFADISGKILEINESALQILGSPSEVATKKINILKFPPLKKIAFDKYFEETIKTKETVQTFFNYTTKWGKLLSTKLTFNPILVLDEFVGILITFVDLTQEKEVERQLQIAKEKAIRADKLKTAFLSNMSHEIRTPMNGILGFAQMLRNSNISENQRKKYIHHIQNSGKILLHLINDIIDLSKVEANELKFNPIKTDLKNLTENLFDFYNLEIKRREEKHIKLDLVLPNNKEIYNIMVDSYRLRQVLDNLLSNALKFTQTGSIRFGFEEVKNKNKIQFFVADTGIGISSTNLPYIFDRFTQGFEENEKQNFGGTGLGLAVSKKIVEQMGGSIWAESTYGERSQFYFTIPLKKAVKTKKSPTHQPNFKINWEDKTILVAEDDEISLLLLEEMLSTTGINVLKAMNGEEAINLFNNNNVDILLLDIQMPVKNGLSVLKEVKKQTPDIPVLVQTAYALNNEKEICYANGCNEYISKPIEYDSLIIKLQKYLSK